MDPLKGEHFKDRIQKYLDTYLDFKGVLLPFIASEKGEHVGWNIFIQPGIDWL